MLLVSLNGACDTGPTVLRDVLQSTTGSCSVDSKQLAIATEEHKKHGRTS